MTIESEEEAVEPFEILSEAEAEVPCNFIAEVSQEIVSQDLLKTPVAVIKNRMSFLTA